MIAGLSSSPRVLKLSFASALSSLLLCDSFIRMVLAAASSPFMFHYMLDDGLVRLCHAFREEWDDVRNWPTAAKRLGLLSHRLRQDYTDLDSLFSANDAPYIKAGYKATYIKAGYKATYIIDLLCQLEWLLQSLLLLQHSKLNASSLSAHSDGSVRYSAPGDEAYTTQFPDHLAHGQVTELLKIIQPILDTCRCIYAACTFSATARSKFLSKPTRIKNGAVWGNFLAHCNRVRAGSFSLQDLLESVDSHEEQAQPPFYTWPLALVDVLDLMLEIASIARIWEECKFLHGHLIPQSLCLYRAGEFGHGIDLIYAPTHFSSAGNCYIAPEISKFRAYHSMNISSDVYCYGSVCFNILTADVPGALKFTQTIRSRAEFYKFVREGHWKQMVHGRCEYLVRLIAWCWETDPRKRPAFSTICSLLQRAMRCLIFPPVLNLTRLSNFLQKRKYSLLNLYLSLVWSRDISCHVFGSGTLSEMVQTFHHDTIEQQHFSSDFMCSKVMQAFAQVKACRRMMGDPSNVEALVLSDANTTESANHPSSISCHSGDNGSVVQHQKFLSKSQLIEKVKASWRHFFGASTQEEDLACERGELELGSLIELEKEFDSSTVLNSDVFEQHSVIFEALVYDCMLASFPPLDYQFWIRPLINMSHHNQKLPIPLPKMPFERLGHINHALLPHLVSCWSGQTCSQGN